MAELADAMDLGSIGNPVQVRPLLSAPSLLYEKATTDKKHKLPTYLVFFCMLILCFCRWTKSLNLTAAFS